MWLAGITALLIVADFFGNFIASFFEIMGKAGKGIVETGKTEYNELENTNVYSPSGKKFFDEGFSRIGKEVGKSEKAKAEGKSTKLNLGLFSTLGTASENFLNGLFSLFKK